jgi:hypothetical protein
MPTPLPLPVLALDFACSCALSFARVLVRCRRISSVRCSGFAAIGRFDHYSSLLHVRRSLIHTCHVSFRLTFLDILPLSVFALQVRFDLILSDGFSQTQCTRMSQV